MRKFKNVFRATKLTFHCDKKYIFIKIAAVLFNSVLSFVSLYINKLFISVLISDSPSLKLAIFYLLLGIAINLTLVLKNFLQARYYPKIDLKLTYQLQEALIKTVSEVEYCQFDSPEFYDSMEYALKETNGLTKTIDLFLNTLSAIVDLTVAIVLCLRYDSIIPLILLPGIVPYYFIKAKLNKYSYDVSKELNAIGRKTSAIRHLLTSKYYAHEVRSFNLFDFLISKYKRFVNDRIDVTIVSTKKQTQYTSLSSVLNFLMGFIASLRLVFLLIRKGITFADFTLLQSYVIKIQGSLNTLIESYMLIEERNLYLDNLFSFLDQAQQKPSASGTIELQKATSHKVEFRHVTFKYPNSEQTILDDISFVIEPGETVMLVGENGAGKTTMLMLLNLFYDNYTGEILIDDINIKTLESKSLRRAIAMMFQSGSLLPLTLLENIGLGRNITEKEYQDYPWFKSLVSKYPDGINTILLTYMYPNGIQPSGGEVQRIKLMRTILKKGAGILVLDEPTSAIDPETEYQILTSMKEIAKDRTTILVSHKLSCATYADKVIHLEHGKIIENGSHQQLMKSKGKYSKLFKMQAENYVETPSLKA